MKKIIFLLAFIFSAHCLLAQDTSMNNKNMMHNNMHKMKDCVYMKNGKMIEMMNGKNMIMDKDMKLKSRTIVMTDGTVKMKDGSTKRKMEGECMYMYRKMENMKMDHNMIMRVSTKQQ